MAAEQVLQAMDIMDNEQCIELFSALFQKYYKPITNEERVR